MDTNSYYVQTWILISIVIYTGLIVLVVIVRHCYLKKAIFPCNFANCRTKSLTDLCCGKNHTANEPSCLGLPMVKCRCFPPDFSYSSCFCCEVVCESNGKVDAKHIESDCDSDL